jgi:hypothetical protein
MQIKQEKASSRIFLENPYDLETVFESMSIASDRNKELLFMDKFISSIRANPEDEITSICYKVLSSLDILELKKSK